MTGGLAEHFVLLDIESQAQKIWTAQSQMLKLYIVGSSILTGS